MPLRTLLVMQAELSELPGDFLQFPAFEQITDLKVLVAVEQDAALDPFLNLADIVFDPLETGHLRFGNPVLSADHADHAVPPHEALGHHATSHHAGLGDLEELADLGAADEGLFDGRLEQYFDSGLDGADQLVD